MHGTPIAVAWKFLVGVIVPIKIAILGVGYIAWVVGTPSGADKRRSILEHARKALQASGVTEPATLAVLNEDLVRLDTRTEAGWREYADLASLARVIKFTLGLHTSETMDVIREFGEKTGDFLANKLDVLLKDAPRATGSTR